MLGAEFPSISFVGQCELFNPLLSFITHHLSLSSTTSIGNQAFLLYIITPNTQWYLHIDFDWHATGFGSLLVKCHAMRYNTLTYRGK